jgi:uncharacterized protein with PQ loop repeat
MCTRAFARDCASRSQAYSRATALVALKAELSKLVTACLPASWSCGGASRFLQRFKCIKFVYIMRPRITPRLSKHSLLAGRIGDLNPLVFPFLCGNAFAWCAYSVAKRDPYVFGGNIFNAVLGLFYCTSVIGLLECSRTRARLEGLLILLLFAEGVFSFVAAVIAPGSAASNDSSTTLVELLGMQGLVLVMTLFASPLSTVASVVSARNSASISRPFCAVQTANCATWLVYGLLVGDNFVAAPNAFGLITAILQGLLIILFPQRCDAPEPLLECDDDDPSGKPGDRGSSAQEWEPSSPHTPRPTHPRSHTYSSKHSWDRASVKDFSCFVRGGARAEVAEGTAGGLVTDGRALANGARPLSPSPGRMPLQPSDSLRPGMAPVPRIETDGRASRRVLTWSEAHNVFGSDSG